MTYHNGKGPYEQGDPDEITKPDSRTTLVILYQLQEDMEIVKAQMSALQTFSETVLSQIAKFQKNVEDVIERVNDLADRADRYESSSVIPTVPPVSG